MQRADATDEAPLRARGDGADELRDVNQRLLMAGLRIHELADELQASSDRERALEADRRELVASISHDLRTPLTTMLAMIEAIADGVVTDPVDVQRYLDLTRHEILHLGQLVADLFELSKIESGALHLRTERLSLGELVCEMLDAYEADAREHGVRLEGDTEPVPLQAIADPARLQRVLRNLVDNALRHTPSGGRIRVEARAVGAVARVSVTDSGPGVAPEDRERIFERFQHDRRARYRGELSRGDRSSGAGLGLAIARGLVEAHGGRIWVETALLGGAAFHFTVPLVEVTAQG